MTYQQNLPRSFPYCYQGAEQWVRDCVEVLLTGNDEALNGSSFAVTSDAALSARFLWVSAASRQRLIQNGLVGSGDMGNPLDVASDLPDYD